MFEYFLQKSAFRLFLILVAAAFIGMFAYALIIESTIRAPENMEAPFKDMTGEAVVAGMSDGNPLLQQHMSSKEISLLLSQILAEALTFNAGTYDSTVASMQKYFTPEAYQQYLAFLAQGNVKQTLIDQNLQAGAYAEEEPLELNSGVFGTANKAYKWLFQVPVTLSYVPRGTQGYENNATAAQNRRFTLRTQFSRVKDADPNAVKIEIWQVSAARR